jgi:orotidine-5'-phosphate decarboxylase
MSQVKNTNQIIIALDTHDENELISILEKIETKSCFVKVGMELFYGLGPGIIHKIKAKGFKVFLDLKVHDIPNTTRAALKALTQLEVDMITVHASGGKEMMKAAHQGIKDAISEDSNLKRPLLIAVTQLTSTDQKTLNDELGITNSMEQSVLNLAKIAHQSGPDGVVCSPLEVIKVKTDIDKSFICVTPGIRPNGVNFHDQKRTATPAEAIKNGADYLVIGRAITQAKDPQIAIEKIIKEIELGAKHE